MEGKKVIRILLVSFLLLPVILLILFLSFRITNVENSTNSGISLSRDTVGIIESNVSSDYFSGINQVSEDSDSYVIRTGEIRMTVDNINSTLNTIDDINDEFNAIVTNSYDNGEGNERVVSITIKIEENDFDTIYSKLKEIDGDIVYSTINSTDVTEQVVDLNARLKTYQDVETQLLEILKDSTTVTDTLAVHTELKDIRYEIESIQTQLKEMESQTEYSRITVQLSLSSSGMNISEDEWKPVGIFKSALNSLLNFVKLLGSLLIWLIVFSPVIAVFIWIIVLINKKTGGDK